MDVNPAVSFRFLLVLENERTKRQPTSSSASRYLISVGECDTRLLMTDLANMLHVRPGRRSAPHRGDLSYLSIWPERLLTTRAWFYMPEDADRYCRRAEECRRVAEKARDPIIRRQLIETAEALEEAARDKASD